MYPTVKDMSHLFSEYVSTIAAAVTAAFLFPQLQPSTVWLRERYTGGMVFVPNDDGTSFDLPSGDEIPAVLVVEGTPFSEAANQNQQQQAIPGPAPHDRAGPVVQRQQTAIDIPFRKSHVQQCNVKIERADILGWTAARKPVLGSIKQLFVTVTEASADIDHVMAAVQRKWGPDHTIITGNGLKVEDSSGTQGTAVNSVLMM